MLVAWISPFRVISRSPHPCRLLLQLLRPYPFFFPLPAPLSPTSIISNPSIVQQRMDYAGLPESRYIWPFYLRDTSLRCLYRIYEWASIGRPLQVGYETQYFWDQVSWKVEDIPDPRDPDPVRYAVLAGFAETMAICFNERNDLGLLRMGNDGVTNPYATYLRQTLSREEFIAFTEKHHEKAPSWTAGARGPAEPFVFQTDCWSGGIFTKRNIEICGGGNMDWI
ncbi:hypothetical protein EW146_g478 [Bondarzewia mesenterica]|uniref:Uncharacterized protein n=1 Tax=Bondarzewia mesenterica TaxID=1095465 RepID=A0A4S4M6T7_9AGAM|nr:hypothetical protein EW146_g478 [Bondarzewia mesenterica]